jgi:hypothetical protein
MLKNRKELEENLIEVIHTSKLKTKKKLMDDIRMHLANNYGIVDTLGWFNDTEKRIPDLDIRELFLLTEQVFAKTSDMSINPENYFTKHEIKESRQFSALLENKESDLSFPLSLSNATVIGNSAFMVTMNIQTINKLLDNNLLSYNFEVQREAKFVKRKDKVVIEPTLNLSNVKEISEHLLEGTLVPTVLVFNAATRTSESGSELIYDPKNLELTITKGTRLDIVDGYHRCKATQNALQVNPELNFNFAVLITNYSTKKAQQYQAQLAKATPISKTRIQEFEANRLSDTVVQQLKEESDLKGRISQTNRIHSLNKELVTYNVLSDTIDEQFKMESRADSLDVGDYLTEFFNILLGLYTEEFLMNIEETRKTSLINDNNMFIGYLVLARRMYEEDIKAKEIRKIMKNINFNRMNPEWKKLDILDDKGNLLETNKVRKAIREYFENIELGLSVN